MARVVGRVDARPVAVGEGLGATAAVVDDHRPAVLPGLDGPGVTGRRAGIPAGHGGVGPRAAAPAAAAGRHEQEGGEKKNPE
jgi:hypothetical protein